LACGGAVALSACGPLESPETNEPTAAPRRTATTAQALVVSPELSLPLSTPGGSQFGIVAASAGDVSLVVWSETDAYGAEDLLGMRVRKSDGSPVDATPLCIACGPRAQKAPAVASNGTDFLVTWDDVQASGQPRMMSVRVRGSDGAVLGPAQVLRDTAPGNDTSTIASDGSNYLVVWKGYAYSCQYFPWGPSCSYLPALQAARVSAADGSSTSVSVPSTGRSMNGQPHVAYGGGTYLITWASVPSSSSNVYGVRVRAQDGAVLDWSPRLLVSNASRAEVAFDGSRFLVVWVAPGATKLLATRVEQDGTVLDPSGNLLVEIYSPDSIDGHNVLFDGADYRVLWWESMGRYGYPGGLFGVRVTTNGRLASGSRQQLGSSGRQGQALAALGRGRFLVGYSMANKPPFMSPPFEYRAKLKVVEDLPLGTGCTQGVQCQSGLCVDGVCCDSVCGGGAATDCQACSVATGASVDGTCGAARAEAAVVCRPSAVACDVAETCDGASLSCPSDEPPASEPDLSGDKCEDSPCDVANYLATLGPDALEPSFGQGLLSTAGSACRSFQSGDTQAMQGELRALSHQVRAQAGRKLSASVADTLLAALGGLFKPSACVQVQPAEPAPVEPTPVPLAQGPFVSPERSVPISKSGGQRGVVAASAGDITLLVWSEADPTGATDIRGVRVRKSDGTLLDAEALCIACTNDYESSPAVASNGTDFLVTWAKAPYMGPSHVEGVRVKGATGAVIPPYLPLGNNGPSSDRPAVASDGSDYLVVWHGSTVECIFIPPQPWPVDCFRYNALMGSRVSATAAWNGGTFALTAPSHTQSTVAPQASYGGGNYLVTWTGYPKQASSTNPSAYATRVRASDEAVLDKTTPLTVATGASGTNSPVVAFDGSRFLVAWSTLGGEVRASRMGLDGEVLDPGGFPVGTGAGANVHFDGTDYRVAWEQGQSTVRQLKSTRVSREGHVVSGSELVVTQHHYATGASERSALATLGPGRLLVSYSKRSEQYQPQFVKLRTVEHIPQGLACTQDAQCLSGSCVDGVCCESTCGGGLTNDCQACSVAAGGLVDGTCGAVRAEAAVVCRPSAMACDAVETCDGASLACPADEPSVSAPDLTCDKCQDNPCDVANYLGWMGPELLLQPIGPGLQRKADEACAAFQAGDTQAAQRQLQALLNEVRAQSGKQLSTSTADMLIGSITGLLGP
jgi:hypothetical protein